MEALNSTETPKNGFKKTTTILKDRHTFHAPFFSSLCSLKELKATPISSYLTNFSLFAKTRLKRVYFVLGLKAFLCDITKEENRARENQPIRFVGSSRAASARGGLNLGPRCLFMARFFRT